MTRSNSSASSARRLALAALFAPILLVSAGCVAPLADEALGADPEALDSPTCSATAAGSYCGQGQIHGGTANVLYSCAGKDQAASVARTCPRSCVVAPTAGSDFCGGSFVMTSHNLEVMVHANLRSNALLWESTAQLEGGESLDDPDRMPVGTAGNKLTTVGSGEALAFVVSTSEKPTTSASWVKGAKVLGGAIPLGTAIATFSGSTYGGHAGFFGGYTNTGFTIFDQNFGSSSVVEAHALATSASPGATNPLGPNLGLHGGSPFGSLFPTAPVAPGFGQAPAPFSGSPFSGSPFGPLDPANRLGGGLPGQGFQLGGLGSAPSPFGTLPGASSASSLDPAAYYVVLAPE